MVTEIEEEETPTPCELTPFTLAMYAVVGWSPWSVYIIIYQITNYLK